MNNCFLKVLLFSHLLTLCLLLSNQANGQQSLVFQERYPDFENALELFQKEKFTSAQAYFEKTIENISDVHSEVRIEAEYYQALCAIHLFHSNANALLKKFIEKHPESVHINSAYFQLANYMFRKKDYEEVLEWLGKLHPLDLSEKERAEYYFKKGYAHFQLEEYTKAASSFYEIKDTDNEYVSAARYYYAHIAYFEGKYETAVVHFKKIENDPQFGPLVPYYLSQLYYMQGKYDELLAYAPAILESESPKRELEIRKLVGDSYYKTKKYKEAIPYLSAFLERKAGVEVDYYQLGIAYFETAQYSEAMSFLEKSIGDNDTLSQSAYYYIGESGIKSKNKLAAKQAFRNAYKLNVDDELTEDALFNYAKLAYELSYHPYDDAILAFEEFISNYPNSTKIKDAYEYMIGVYYTTKNYEEALKSLNRINSKDIELLQAKQRVAYYRGVELFNDQNYLEAVEKFQISLNHNYEPKIRAGAQFWMAEAFYRLGDYDNAANYFSDFLASSGARSLDYYSKGYYHLGYVYYEKRSYKSTIFWLNEYIENANAKDKGLINDAYLRIGDSYFIQKQYNKAIEAYAEAEKIGIKDKDYALLQSAISYGVQANYQNKAQLLKRLVKTNEQSVYKDDALFELGKTYLLLKQEQEALAYYNQLINDFPKSNYLAEAHLKVGLIHYNQRADDLALNAFNTVVKNYGNSSHASAALEKIRKIYIDKGDAEAFEDYINGVPFANISKAKLDSTAYVIAENNYLEGNCEKATRDFTNYLKRYPQGVFSLNAHFYRGSCEAAAGFDQEAASDFEFVLDKPSNKFTEKALVELARIYRSMDYLDSAAVLYKELLSTAVRTTNQNQARIALMEIYFEKEDYKSASEYAKTLLDGSLLPTDLWQKAQLTLAKTYFEQENYQQSEFYLDTLSSAKTKFGAEAKYMLAQMHYLKGNYAESDSMIYLLVDQVPSFPYWIAKGFILLADNFIAKGDAYNARVTFQSVIDNAEDEELLSIAKEKLRILNDSEKKQLEEEEIIEIELNNNEEENSKLFESDTTSVKTVKEANDEE